MGSEKGVNGKREGRVSGDNVGSELVKSGEREGRDTEVSRKREERRVSRE